MKYNPVVNEGLARLPGFAALHPLVPETLAQGALELLAALEAALAAVSGLDAVCLQPAAGAHGELLGMLLVRAYHVDRGDARRRVLIPSSAHGTNPASATLCGYEVTEVPVDARGLLSARAVAAAMDESVAALMITNPNTLGLFEREIDGITATITADAQDLVQRAPPQRERDAHSRRRRSLSARVERPVVATASPEAAARAAHGSPSDRSSLSSARMPSTT